MNELSLFSGAGGGLLGTMLLGWKPVGYVEWNNYCQRVIRHRINNGLIEDAPIFGDIDAFIGQGYARAYQGLVDVVTAGFPCQPFSAAGKGRAADDQRNKWPQTIEVIRQVGPQFALLENSPRLISFDYFGEILGDLAEAGYDAEWDVISALSVGAEHLRNRVWLLAFRADAMPSRFEKLNIPSISGNKTTRPTRNDDQLSDDTGSYAKSDRREAQSISAVRRQPRNEQPCHNSNLCHAAQIRKAWAVCEPGVVGMADDVAHRVDRIGACGNGQVPGVVVTAWTTLAKRAGLIQ